MTFSHGEFAELNGLLAAAAERGLALGPAIDLLAAEGRARGALGSVSRALGEGASLPDALASAPAAFSPDYCGLVAAGLAARRLPEVFRTVQRYHALCARLASKVARLLVYLALGAVMVELLLVLAGLFGKWFLEVMEAANMADLSAAAGFAAYRWLPVVGFPIFVGVGTALIFAVRGSAWAAWAGNLLPVWGKVARSRDLALFSAAMALRLRSGANLVESLKAAQAVLPLRRTARRVDGLLRAVEEGNSLSSALFYDRFWPRALAWGVSLGEARGDLPAVFDTFAGIYAAEMERRFEIIFQVLTPVGILALANVVLLAISMLLAPLVALGGMSGRALQPDPMIRLLGGLIVLAVFDAPILLFIVGYYALVTARRTKIYVLIDHLASLAERGFPIHAGLRAMGQDLGGFLGTRLARAARRVEDGMTLGEALQASPGAFPALLRGMVWLGDRCGNLAGFLAHLRRSYRRLAEMPSQTVYLFLYPALLTFVIYAVLLWMHVEMVPRLNRISQMMRLDAGDYPGLWSALLAAAHGVLILCIASGVVLITGGVSPHFGALLLGPLKRLADRGAMAFPFLGGILRDAALHQFALAAALFLRAGAGLPEALGAAAGAEGNTVLRRRFERIARRVGEGERFSRVARAEGLPEDLTWFVETGEAAGTLPDHLEEAARHYDTKTRFAAAMASRAVVPFFVIANGALVGTAFALTFVPMFRALRAVIPA